MSSVKKTLAKFQELNICDDASAEALNVEDPSIQHYLTTFAKLLEGNEEASPDDLKETLGQKVLFLEQLVQAPQEAQAQVNDWLRDPKRFKVFTEASSGDIYGELLLAKAERKLDSYLATYNGNQHQPLRYLSATPLRIEANVKNAQELFNNKLEAILGKVSLDESLNRAAKLLTSDQREEQYQLYLTHCTQDRCEEDPELQKLAPLLDAINTKDRNKLKRTLSSLDPRDAASHITSFFDHSFDPKILRDKTNTDDHEAFASDREYFKTASFDYMKFISYPKEKLSFEDFSRRQDALSTRFDAMLNRARNPFIENIIQGLYDTNNTDSMFTEFYQLNAREDTEFQSLSRSAEDSNKKVSEKIKMGATLEYRLEHAQKDPLDVRYGNDGGCCIGVYDDGDIGNAYGLPHMIADNSIHFFNVMQKTGERKPVRVGIVLAFDATDKKGNKVLACNSLELSPRMNPANVLKDLVGYCEQELVTFGKKYGYDSVVMGSHDYNTSENYSKHGKKRMSVVLKKAPCKIKRPFYSELFVTELSTHTEGSCHVYALDDEN